MSMMQASLIKDSLLAGLVCWETNCIRMKVWGCLIAAGILLFLKLCAGSMHFKICDTPLETLSAMKLGPRCKKMTRQSYERKAEKRLSVFFNYAIVSKGGSGVKEGVYCKA